MHERHLQATSCPRARAAILLAVLTAALGTASPAPAQEVTGEQVRLAIRAGIDYLQSRQRPAGNWPDYPSYPGGTTALAVLALRQAGVPATDASVIRGAELLTRLPDTQTYVVSLKIQALAAVDPKRYAESIRQSANWLIQAQRRKTGLWSYMLRGHGGDHSNSQFALLGLHEAGRAGVDVPDQVWRLAEKEWLAAQRRDGGWTYMGAGGLSTGSMTAAGIASLYVVGNNRVSTRERGYLPPGRARNCGRFGVNRPVRDGLNWLGRNFDANRNPPANQFYYYYLYAVERVGILSGLRYFGEHDWYREGAAALVARQQPDGSWRDDRDTVVSTAFALLFLGKGHRSLLINKLRWTHSDEWQPDPHDIENLIAFIGDQLGEPVSWQVVDLDADLEEWLAAPILYFNGHDFPKFSKDEVAKFQEFVRQGGAILAEACCTRREFREGFEAFAAQAFPDTPLHPLAEDHPVFHARYELEELKRKFDVHGIDVGCRTSIIFLPKDLSCLWEQADIPDLSEQAFKLGTNIAAYLAGREQLRDRLDVVHLVRADVAPTDVPPSALFIAQIMHSGDWRPDPHAVANLAEFLRDQSGVDVVPEARPLAPTDPALAKHPVAFMTGHFHFELTDAELDALRTWLTRGGFLFADACCGRAAFDQAFRKMAADLFPDNALEPLPRSHPILSGELGYQLDTVAYRPALRGIVDGSRGPVLEGITIGGRTVLVYSPYAIGCPIDGHACFGCRGLVTEDAKRLAANIVLYALSY